MKTRLCLVNANAVEKLPPFTGGRSGVGVHYVDAYLLPMNGSLDDGTPVTCRRKGLRIVLTVGDMTGEGLLRRLEVGPDPVAMLDAALQEAALDAGVSLRVEDGVIVLSL